ncbi:MerR family transcriptional regulator [Pseudonocardia ailaonensis]|uniref:MerR family transcriptional regulator n=1 Tax=Pseudonocardia ailaonensis TaxID=367279 RepID=A0ABN2NQ15_9PSEU
MRIGELAERAGVSTRALRHYEELGLLPARRAANGYRAYGAEDLRAVAEIRTLVGLGLSLEETRPFVECLRAGHPTGGSCASSIAVYRQKLAEVDASLARLGAVRAELETQLQEALRERAPEPRCGLTPVFTPEGT